METHLTLDSLFDGSGGFPLAGVLSGITPVWASCAQYVLEGVADELRKG